MVHPPLRNYEVMTLPDAAVEAIEASIAETQAKRETGPRPCPLCSHKPPDPFGYKSRVIQWGLACSDCTQECNHANSVTGYLVASNGAARGCQYCFRCGSLDSLPRGAAIFNVCIRSHVESAPPCERCGSTEGAEQQHWAPHAIFKDSWDWPTSWLCRPCHRLWHNAMRAAKGVSLPEAERVAIPSWKPWSSRYARIGPGDV